MAESNNSSKLLKQMIIRWYIQTKPVVVVPSEIVRMDRNGRANIR